MGATQVKTKKLKKLMSKLKAAQAEKRDLFGEFQSEKEAMHETIRDLERQLKYSDLIIEVLLLLQGMREAV